MKATRSIKELRSFGLLVGGIFAAIGLWPALLRGDEMRLWSLFIGGLLILSALLVPRALALPHRGWMELSDILGWLNTRIILGFIFFILLTPIGIVRRFLGSDPMGSKLNPQTNTYRIPRQSRSGSHMTRQY